MFSFFRQIQLATVCIVVSSVSVAQSNRCDSIEWNFGVNQFAIDGDNLMADLADKGWDNSFFQTKEIEVTIYGATDCPGSYAYNTKLAGNRALYLLNYFEVSDFPKLTIADSYAIPERNCVKPGQGYNPDDRVTHLKVCWNDGDANTAVQNAHTEVSEVAPRSETEVTQNNNVGGQVENAAPADSAAVKSNIENALQAAETNAATDSTQAIQPQTNNPNGNAPFDSTQYSLPTKPKKIFTLEKTADLHTGDELIMDGLNFYPGSHRTLPEAKTVLRLLLETMKEKPTVMIEIQGHVCCASKPNEDGLDDETGDFRLSWNRAQFVRDYLVQNGISPERITYRGYAMTRPMVYPEVTIQDQIQNRRVEILITAE